MLSQHITSDMCERECDAPLCLCTPTDEHVLTCVAAILDGFLKFQSISHRQFSGKEALPCKRLVFN